MTNRRVVVFGGTGFLGRKTVDGLTEAGWRVRVAVRRPERLPDGPGQGPEACYADVRDETSVRLAVARADAVVNAVGCYVERGPVTFEAVHAQGALHVARQADHAKVGRLIHISGIGADATSDSSYVRARARGEALVKGAFPNATILRPSVLFGPGDAFFGALAAIARRVPVLPLFGHGDTRLQPVFVGDVAQAVARALDDPAAAGTTYELGGPKVYSYRALVDLLLRRIAVRPILLPVPFAVWDLQARLLGLLPNPPLTRDQVSLMRRDNLAAADAPGLSELGVTPTSVEAVLPTYLGGD